MRSLLPYQSAQDVIDFLNARDAGTNMTIQSENDTFGVLVGDQLLFVGERESECADFLYGLVTGGTLFSELAADVN